MITLTIIKDIFARQKEVVETEDLLDYLYRRFPSWPKNARLFHEKIAFSHEVTPRDAAGVEKLAALEGDMYLLALPGEPVTIVAIIVAVIAVALAMFLKPSIPDISQRNTRNTSPNNELSARGNKPRPHERIPDIFGTVRSTPDLIVAPYSEYDANVEVEHAVMCIGRGQYEIHDMYDGETACDQISGVSAQVYKPQAHINTDEPYYRVGPDIEGEALVSIRSNSVNGQKLEPSNKQTYNGNNNLIFSPSGKISLLENEGEALQINGDDGDNSLIERFKAGDVIEITGAAVYETEPLGIVDAVPFRPGGTWQTYYPSSTLSLPYSQELYATLSRATEIELVNAQFSGNLEYGNGRNTSVSVSFNGRHAVRSVTVAESRILLALAITRGSYNPPSQLPGKVEWEARSLACLLHTKPVYSLNGVYTIAAASNNSLFLDDPAQVNPDWDYLQTLPEGRSLPLSAVLTGTGENWVGPFILEDTARTSVWANLVALNGLYKDNGERQYAVDVTILFEITPIDTFNEPLGEAQAFEFTLKGSTLNRSTIGLTAKMETAFKGRCRIRARRLTLTDTGFRGSVMDEVQFKDLYAMSALPTDNFGDVTIVRAKTVATSGALAVKERKLNCLVTRQIRKRVAGGEFTEDLQSTNSVADIFCHLSLDPYIGNRNKAELDLDNIYATVAQVEEYFGTPLLAEFCYTLDDSSLSYEETASMVAGVSFCTPYRMGSIIRLFFEKETDLSVMLFNHRNKIPGSETRTVTFGFSNDNDGVRYEYVSPEDDAIVTVHLPEDQSAVNPAKIESVGVRNNVQAHIHAWRTWNKMKYQSVSLQFKATYEADLLLRGERILVADNIAGKALDGEVEDQQGLEIFTSRELSLEPGREYVCFLQLCDKTTQAIPARAGSTPRSFLLRYPPNIPLVYDDDQYAKTTFLLTCDNSKSADSGSVTGNALNKGISTGNDASAGSGSATGGHAPGNAFIVTEKKAQEELTVELEAVNYDARYYMRDADFKQGIVKEL